MKKYLTSPFLIWTVGWLVASVVAMAFSLVQLDLFGTVCFAICAGINQYVAMSEIRRIKGKR